MLSQASVDMTAKMLSDKYLMQLTFNEAALCMSAKSRKVATDLMDSEVDRWFSQADLRPSTWYWEM